MLKKILLVSLLVCCFWASGCSETELRLRNCDYCATEAIKSKCTSCIESGINGCASLLGCPSPYNKWEEIIEVDGVVLGGDTGTK